MRGQKRQNIRLFERRCRGIVFHWVQFPCLFPKSKQSSRLCVFAEVHSSLFKPHSKSWLQNTRAREFKKQQKITSLPPNKKACLPPQIQKNIKKTKLQQPTKFKGFLKSTLNHVEKFTTTPMPQLQGTRIEDCLEYQGQGWRSKGPTCGGYSGGAYGHTCFRCQWSEIFKHLTLAKVRPCEEDQQFSSRWSEIYLRITRATSNDLCDLQWRKSSPLRNPWKNSSRSFLIKNEDVEKVESDIEY